jgi:hypothetical protein
VDAAAALETMGIEAVIHRAEAGRRRDSAAVGPVVSTLVARRTLGSGSKLAAIRWVAERSRSTGWPGSVMSRPTR